ncbi:MAG: EutN/CcmL family microcompartment protein [Candidatus Wallbacteria bacterium]|nr:EutN/CcmL family microcompartment protein [Candidatus Wallbacteria bacterium]
MILARVKGNLVSTCKEPRFDGYKLLLVQPVSPLTGKDEKGELIAVDFVGAGAGETVLVVNEGSVAAELFHDDKVPLSAVIVGIVDKIEIADRRE